MHIKSIELDGFKSYQKHVEIAPFSPRFNAITGYNGSGKSNVLDSICFVLGITKLDAVRAKHMSELIAHGLTKASVQIRFDNRNKEQSPFGMENFDEITVVRNIVSNGRSCLSSYYLNGHSVPNTRMADFFRGVGLNVNNPHFLIMQGRITTVLNMKPDEILGMVEEAAGTKMYDMKKNDAMRTLYVKDSKLAEIDQIFETSINPRMEKFREDRKNMIEVTRLQKMKDNAKRKADAFEYYQTLEQKRVAEANVETAKKRMEENDASIALVQRDAKKKEDEKVELTHLRDNPTHETAFAQEVKAGNAHLLACQTERRAIIDEIAKLESTVKLNEKRIEAEEKEKEKTERKLKATEEQNAAVLNVVQENEERIKVLRDELETLTRGTIANDKGEQVSLESAIQDSRSAASVLQTNVRTARNRLDRVHTSINMLKTKLDGMSAKARKEEENHAVLKADVERCTAELERLGFDAATDATKRNRNDEITQRLRELKRINDDILDRACGGRYALNLITPPDAAFDSERDVEGLVVWLVKLKPQYRQYHQAVDIGLGGLYQNIVVRTQDTARILIESKAFNLRRTLIPWTENGRKSGHVIENSVVAKAQKIADGFNETVLRLIDMVEFPAKIDNTFKSAIGQILVVQTLPCARAVAFGEGVQTRVLTARGDDVKTTGVMSGGASDKGDQHVITALESIHRQFDEMAVLKEEQGRLIKYLTEAEAQYRLYCVANGKLQEAERKLVAYQNTLKTSEIGRSQAEMETLQKTRDTITEEIDKANAELSVLNRKLDDLESRKSSDKGDLEKRKTAVNNEIKQRESQNEGKNSAVTGARGEIMRLQAAITQLEASMQALQAANANFRDEIAQKELLVPAATQKCEEAEKSAKESEDKMKTLKCEQRNVVDRIAKLQRDMVNLRKEEIRLNGLKEDIERESNEYGAAIENCKAHVKTLEKRFEWLVDEKIHFNKKDTIYDFEGYTTGRGTTEMKDITDRINNLERSLCMKNVSNLDSCEAKVIDIRNKREKLREDYNILKKTIAILDVKKVEELERAHESVNRDFGKIFNCLLPDATAELVAPEGKSVCDGLEFKVAFNGVVKESLHELSGGQRSLVALSLILAMLKFKPAPLYILDEVDAALDLSHTANIGKMIKDHFNDNQFIIVSLKQGMFSNADCLFQTHFADGHSTCTRLTGAALQAAQRDAKLAAQATELEAEAVKQAKKPAKKTTKKPAPPVDEMDDEMA